MYILLCGSPPFYGKKDEEIFRNIKKGNFHFYYPQFKNVSDNAKDLISQLLKYDKNKRISAKDALNHPFFTEDFNLNQKIDINILIRLKNLKSYNKIQQAVIAYLTMSFIDKDEEKKLRDVFRYIDKNSSGYIKKDDIKKAFKEQNLEIDENNLKNIFDILDSDSNGYIEYQEFLRALVDKENLFSENNLKQVFELFDKDKSGQITWDDLYGIFFQSENKNINEETVQKFLEEINMKKEDSINFEQFSKIMKNCL
jgi:calcium-dependent protein kinase